MKLADLLEQWAGKYDVKTVLERAVGPAATPACAPLAARGARVVVVVDDAEVADRVRATYGAAADVRVVTDEREWPKCDLVIVHGGAPGGGADWRGPLAALGKHATKLVVVVAANPRTIEARARSLFAAKHAGPAWGATDAMAPVLWDLGRVREHAWLDVPSLAARAPRFTKTLAPLHAFVVDVTPRSPQARRRLRLQET